MSPHTMPLQLSCHLALCLNSVQVIPHGDSTACMTSIQHCDSTACLSSHMASLYQRECHPTNVIPRCVSKLHHPMLCLHSVHVIHAKLHVSLQRACNPRLCQRACPSVLCLNCMSSNAVYLPRARYQNAVSQHWACHTAYLLCLDSMHAIYSVCSSVLHPILILCSQQGACHPISRLYLNSCLIRQCCVSVRSTRWSMLCLYTVKKG